MLLALCVFGCVLSRTARPESVAGPVYPPTHVALPNELSCRQVEAVLLEEEGSTFTGRCDTYYDFEDAPKPDLTRLKLEDQRWQITHCLGQITQMPASYTITTNIRISGHTPYAYVVSKPNVGHDYWKIESCIKSAIQALRLPQDVTNAPGDSYGYVVTWHFVYPQPISYTPLPETWRPLDTVEPGELQIEEP